MSARIAEQARAGWLARVNWGGDRGRKRKSDGNKRNDVRNVGSKKEEAERRDCRIPPTESALFSIGAFGDNLELPTLSRQSVSAIDYPARLGPQACNLIHALT